MSSLGSPVSPVRCEGCDCRNETVDADPYYPDQYGITGTGLSEKDWPCCNEEAAPCSYAVIAECEHEYPATEFLGSASYGGLLKPTGFPSGEDPKLLYPIFELKKECITGCRYSWNYNLITDPRMYPVDTSGVTLTEGFPTYRTVDGEIQHVKPRWRPGNNIGCLVGEEPDYRLWSLVDITANPVQLTWDFHGLPGENDPLTQLGVSAPVYESVSGWIRWGRNRMRLTEASQREWPSLRPEVCVVAVDYPYLPNPCETLLDRCNCMDPGTAQTSFDVTIAGCSNFSGTYTVLFSRYRQDLGDTLPCGVSYPASAPCGVFWSDNPIGTGEEICVNEGVNWTGSALGFLNWCDGANYHVELFCYNLDTECWVSQGEATITVQEPRCQGMYLEFTLPPINCCCTASTPCTCGDINYSDSLTIEIVAPDCPAIDGLTANLTASSNPACDHVGQTRCASQDAYIVFWLTCDAGVFRLRVTVDTIGITSSNIIGSGAYSYNEVASTVSSSPFMIEFPAASVGASSIALCEGGCTNPFDIAFVIT